MKQFILFISLLTASVALNSCSKSNDPTPDPVVGKWAPDYLLASGFVAPYTSNNGAKLNPLAYGISDSYEIKTDKSFIYTDRSGVVITPYPGTWDYTGTQLNLKYDNGNSETFTYDGTGTTPLLLYPVQAVSDSLVNPTTNKKELVKFNLQLVYSKQ
ncbi:hypothetical protein [Spirosoma foliorum]|uniref:Lipocalin-like domain-containing protein n=1 Tax=Spirosoma foliorum TaxID=2710596 RepID=A0A7G5GSB3_9BACT|nr:hypothetical protein [Spirosoma foliorum]QMW01755.1 hypothetical protein H3H32_27980 [Spirosoma foliorum]